MLGIRGKRFRFLFQSRSNFNLVEKDNSSVQKAGDVFYGHLSNSVSVFLCRQKG